LKRITSFEVEDLDTKVEIFEKNGSYFIEMQDGKKRIEIGLEKLLEKDSYSSFIRNVKSDPDFAAYIIIEELTGDKESDFDIKPEKADERDMGRLNEHEKDIVISRHGLFGEKKETLEKVGARYNVTRESIRQRQARALKKMYYHLIWYCKKRVEDFLPSNHLV